MQTNILQHNQSKKLEILRTAQELENQGYPITKICDRITKALQGPKYETSGSYVRKVLPPKYKDQEQMATALKQNNGKNADDKDYRLRDQVAKKSVEEVTLEDVKFLNWSKAKQVAKHQMIQQDLIKINNSRYGNGVQYPTPAVLANYSEKLGNNESAISVLTDNSRCG
jgi:hypothetical protein